MAQSWKFDVGVNGGYSWITPMLGEEETGLPDGSAGSEVKFRPGWLVGAQIGYWFSPRFGLRLNGRYSDRPLTGTDLPDDFDFLTSVNLWGATADLMLRLKTPNEEYTGTEVLPYLALGAGAKWHNPGYDNFFCHEPGKRYACGPFVTGGPAGRGWVLGEENEIAGLAAIGADWRISRTFFIRTELSDQFYRPQVHTAAIPTGGNLWEVPTGDQEAKWVHEVGVQVGLHLAFGLAAPPPVAVAPPPPPPATPPPPPPPPPVTREAMTICVIDPAAPGGIRMQAVTLVGGRDTVVVEGGTDRPFRETVGVVTVAGGAEWYVQGQPLVMTIGRNKAEYATYGAARVVDANDLAFVGTINGFPVYADRDDVAEITDELTQLNRARAGTDLGVILNENRTLRNEFAKVKVLYVPTVPAGCVFQAVQLQEEVRKGGK
jgi:hypothetical protein